jgi:hypothetical protein
MLVKQGEQSIHSGLKRMLRSLVRWSLESVKTFIALIVLVVITLGIFNWLLSIHWSLGFLLILFYGYATVQGIHGLKTQELNLLRGLGGMVLSVCLSAGIFATVSFMIMSIKAGSYIGTSEVRFVHLLLYYAWLFLDLLPAIDATKTLGIAPPIEHRGIVAALPIVAYKGFVLLVLLKAIKDWWAKKPAANGPPSISQSAQQVVGPERRERVSHQTWPSEG